MIDAQARIAFGQRLDEAAKWPPLCFHFAGSPSSFIGPRVNLDEGTMTEDLAAEVEAAELYAQTWTGTYEQFLHDVWRPAFDEWMDLNEAAIEERAHAYRLADGKLDDEERAAPLVRLDRPGPVIDPDDELF
jgi:hypothetical protein